MAFYGTIVDGDIYFEFSIWGVNWKGASSGDKIRGLQTAQRLIDNLALQGDDDPNQVLRFPRLGQDSVPQKVEFAAYEIAEALLAGHDPNKTFDDLGIRSQTLGGTKVRTDAIPEYASAGIPSKVAWDYLLPYLRRDRSVRLVRG